MKIKVSPLKNLAKLLREEVGAVVGAVRGDLEKEIEDLAIEVKEKIAQLANDKLYGTREQYKSSLRIVPLDNLSFAIVLDASAAHLEEGYDSFDMKPGLLKEGLSDSQLSKQKSGIRTSKDGYRYRAIPFDQGTKQANPQHPDHNRPIQIQNRIQGGVRQGDGSKTGNSMKGDIAANLKQVLKKTGLSGTTKDDAGNPILGKVATVTPGSEGGVNVNMGGNSFQVDLGKSMGGSTNEMDPLLAGVTKYQFKNGNKVQSAYLTFRMVSNNPKHANKWIHPGFEGVKAFDRVYSWAETRFEEILERIFRGAP